MALFKWTDPGWYVLNTERFHFAVTNNPHLCNPRGFGVAVKHRTLYISLWAMEYSGRKWHWLITPSLGLKVQRV